MNTRFFDLIATVQELRGQNGCPWDKRQSTVSLVKYLKSEFSELIAAIDNNDPENLCEELGDLLFLIVIVAQINQEEGNFSIEEVVTGVTEKLIRRHPHVFADVKISNEQELQEQWQRIKLMEKAKK